MSNNEFADGLRAVAAFYEEHQDIPAPSYHTVDNYCLGSKEDAARVIRALGSCEKNYDYKDFFVIRKKVGQVTMEFTFTRSNVCARKVVGVETIPAVFVEAHTVPAQTKEIVEWECLPILADEAKPPLQTTALSLTAKTSLFSDHSHD